MVIWVHQQNWNRTWAEADLHVRPVVDFQEISQISRTDLKVIAMVVSGVVSMAVSVVESVVVVVVGW